MQAGLSLIYKKSSTIRNKIKKIIVFHQKIQNFQSNGINTH